MKRLIAILLVCLLLMTGVAAAEGANERTRTIVIQGVEETVTEYEYISPSGYSMWVDSAHFVQAESLDDGTEMFTEVVADADVHAQLMFLVTQTEVPNDQAGTYILEAVASYPEDMVSEVQFVEMETGLNYYTISAHDSGVNFIFYAIEGNGGLLSITVAYPIAMEAEYAERVISMVNTIAVLNADADYVSDAGFTMTYNEAIVKPAAFAGTEHDYFVPVGTAEGESPAASLLIVPNEVAWEEAESFLGEAVAMYPEESVTVAETGSGDVEYMTRAASEQGVTYRFYAVKAPEGLLCVTAVYPDGNASFEGVFRNMIESIAFN